MSITEELVEAGMNAHGLVHTPGLVARWAREFEDGLPTYSAACWDDLPTDERRVARREGIALGTGPYARYEAVRREFDAIVAGSLADLAADHADAFD